MGMATATSTTAASATHDSRAGHVTATNTEIPVTMSVWATTMLRNHDPSQ